MNIEKLKKYFPTQMALARALGGKATQAKHVMRAHRIFKGVKPHEEEIKLIYKHTKKGIDANFFFGLE